MKQITIKKIENKENYFIAYFKNPVLQASYSVCFPDTVCGAVALNDFFQMLKVKYKDDNFEFNITDKTVMLKNEYLLNQLKDIRKEAVL